MILYSFPIIVLLHCAGALKEDTCQPGDRDCSEGTKFSVTDNDLKSKDKEYKVAYEEATKLLGDHVTYQSYHEAIFANPDNFRDKTVLAITSGLCLPAIFAAQNGAKLVIVAGKMPHDCATLVETNGLQKKIVEQAEPKSEIDTILMDPFEQPSIFSGANLKELFRYRSLLKSTGRIFPARTYLFTAAADLSNHHRSYQEALRFFNQTNFYNVDLSWIYGEAAIDVFSLNRIDGTPKDALLSPPYMHTLDFNTIDDSDEIDFEAPLRFARNGVFNAVVLWWDLEFAGTNKMVKISNGPTTSGTMQMQMLFEQIIPAAAGHLCSVGIKFQRVDHRDSQLQLNFSPASCPSVSLQPITNYPIEPDQLVRRQSPISPIRQDWDHYNQTNLLQHLRALSDGPTMGVLWQVLLRMYSDFKNRSVLVLDAGVCFWPVAAVQQAGAASAVALERNFFLSCDYTVMKNELAERIKVTPSSVYDVHQKQLKQLDQDIDVLLAPRWSYMGLHGLPLQQILHARKAFLKKTKPKLFPSRLDLMMAPFTDHALYQSRSAIANAIWNDDNYLGIDLRGLRDAAQTESLQKPIINSFAYSVLDAMPKTHTFDFLTMEKADIDQFVIPLDFTLTKTGFIHGLAFWFDLILPATYFTDVFSTSPLIETTQMRQTRLLTQHPLFGREGDHCVGSLTFTADKKRNSYKIRMALRMDGDQKVTNSKPQKSESEHNLADALAVPDTHFNRPQ